MVNSGQAEFPNEVGTFSLEDYTDGSVFHVSGNEDLTQAPISVPAIETPPMATPPVSQASSRSSRRVLATVRVIRADIMLDTGKPSNIHSYNLTVHVNLSRGRCHYPLHLGEGHGKYRRKKSCSGMTKWADPL